MPLVRTHLGRSKHRENCAYPPPPLPISSVSPPYNLIIAKTRQAHINGVTYRCCCAAGLKRCALRMLSAICHLRSYINSVAYRCCCRGFFFFFFFFLAHFHFPASGQAVVTGVIPSPPRFLPTIFIAHRVQQSHWSSIVHRILLTHALALSASQLVHKKKSQRIYTSMHSAGLELTKLTYTRLEDNLIRHRGDRY